MKRLAMLITAGVVLAACQTGQDTTTDPATQPTIQPTTGTGETLPALTPTTSDPTQQTTGETPQPTAETATEAAPPAAVGVPATRDNLTAANFTVGLQLVADGFSHPLVLTHANDNSGRLFIADQAGQIYVIGADGQRLGTPFLDISDRMVGLNQSYDERGLLGLAFHPQYASNGRFYVYYSAPGGSGDHTSHVSEFTVSLDADVADPDSERVIMQIDQPQANHNGGQIRFGPDGYLYIPLGDGGGADDTDEGHVDDWYAENAGGNGQDTDGNLLGSILRIDMDGGDPYGIPADNPWGDEQWAIGFRNPYSMHFDTGGENWLLVGDAGQNRWEEVDAVVAGGNYGWNVWEGSHCFSTDDPDSDPTGCPTTDPAGNPLKGPVAEFGNINQFYGIGLTVVGGTIYRGAGVPALSGMYVFGSWSSSWSHALGQLFVAQPGTPDVLWPMYALPTTDSDMGLLNANILGFGVDQNGEIYVLTSTTLGPAGSTGQVWRIVPGQ